MMGSDQYCLKWNNHWANLIRAFNCLLASETFVDVTLACEGHHIKAHKLILSACSPYFKELLLSHPDRHPIIILKDVRHSELRAVVQFIYNGQASVHHEDLPGLLATARELQIKGLAEALVNGHPAPALTVTRGAGPELEPLKVPTITNSDRSTPQSPKISNDVSKRRDGSPPGKRPKLNLSEDDSNTSSEQQTTKPGPSGINHSEDTDTDSNEKGEDGCDKKEETNGVSGETGALRIATGLSQSEEEDEDSNPPRLNIQSPEVILKEGEECLGASNMAAIQASQRPPMAYLQQALALYAATSIPYLPLGQSKDAAVPFLDLMKASGNSTIQSPLPDPDSLTCHICARNMPNQAMLEEHVRIHEEEKPYKCDQCGQRYKYQSAFQRHQEQNHTAKLPGDKPYRCEICGQCFKYHKSFAKHRSNHDVLDQIMKRENDDGSQSTPPLVPDKPIKLEIDDGTNSSKGETPPPSATNKPENGEIKTEVEDVPDQPLTDQEGEEEDDEGKFFHCLKCKATFKDAATFEGHCKLAPDCTMDAMREVNVSSDNSISHPPSGASSPLSSPYCSPSQAGLQAPTTASSLAIPSVPGPISVLTPPATVAAANNLAGFSFNQPNTVAIIGLNRVLNNTNSGGTFLTPVEPRSGDEERPFKCPYCQKGFKGRENLKLHIRTHTGEKPYNCGVCGKAFGGRSDMNRHLRIHTGEKPYPCKVCGKKFARADYLSKHITTHLGIPFAKPVHSLQQSLQNLENMQNLQTLHKLQTLQNIPNIPKE